MFNTSNLKFKRHSYMKVLSKYTTPNTIQNLQILTTLSSSWKLTASPTIGLGGSPWGSPGLRGPRASDLLDMGWTVGPWRYKTKDSLTRVRMGLSLTWMASLAFGYEDSFLCNRLCTTLVPSGVYINRMVYSVEAIIIVQARLLGF